MINSEILRIITEILHPYLTTDGVCAYPAISLIKYVVNLRDYCLEIQYDYRDNFYRVRLEERKNNQIGQVLLLSKSRAFQKALKKAFRRQGLSQKNFEHHMVCLSKIIREQLDNYNDFDGFQATYISNLKFDGIFL